MDIFTQNKLLIRLIILLALLNVASIGVFVWKDFVKKPRQDAERGNARPPRPEDADDGRPPRPEDVEDGRPPRPEDGKAGRPPRPEDAEKGTPQYKTPQDVAAVLEKELQLTKTQVAQFKTMRAAFAKREEILRAAINVKRDSVNALMFGQSVDETVVKTLARGIAEAEYQTELLRIEQAQSLKALCTPEQLVRFNALVTEIQDYFRPNQ